MLRKVRERYRNNTTKYVRELMTRGEVRVVLVRESTGKVRVRIRLYRSPRLHIRTTPPAGDLTPDLVTKIVDHVLENLWRYTLGKLPYTVALEITGVLTLTTYLHQVLPHLITIILLILAIASGIFVLFLKPLLYTRWSTVHQELLTRDLEYRSSVEFLRELVEKCLTVALEYRGVGYTYLTGKYVPVLYEVVSTGNETTAVLRLGQSTAYSSPLKGP